MNIIVNGKEQEITENQSIEQLLVEMEIKSPMLVVERNRAIIPKERYHEVINEGDRFEIVAFFGGG
ncbi:MAG: sulfur carrier protein ThiS [Candidatus Gastranaerophilales bacterium]|nr:sulfur carrier protein ThiS [Candidatus Gastranaerophilales bacterium]